MSAAKKILIVDDTEEIRNDLCRFFRAQGYDILDAATGAQALEILTRESVDLVISDYVMPGMDGIELIERIHAEWPTTRLVLLSGYLSAIEADMMLKGKAQYISKPTSLSALLNTVRLLLPALAFTFIFERIG
ncbi:MAG TPA: response regulator [Candidatus Binatia bacterium]|nr:response regulator [Candidatus Binatia bacterium]